MVVVVVAAPMPVAVAVVEKVLFGQQLDLKVVPPWPWMLPVLPMLPVVVLNSGSVYFR